MENDIHKLMDTLTENVCKDDFIGIAYDVTDELLKLPNAFEAIGPIIELIASNPTTDFGNPGPLVHFLENFDERQYDEKLVESIRRCPTGHTLFMLNRIINGAKASKKKSYLELFDFVINAPQVSKTVQEIAREFRSFHTGERVDKGSSLLEPRNIVLSKPVDGLKDLIRIKNALGLELSAKELLANSKNLPFTLVNNIPYGRAEKILMNLGELRENLELQPVN